MSVLFFLDILSFLTVQPEVDLFISEAFFIKKLIDHWRKFMLISVLAILNALSCNTLSAAVPFKSLKSP